MELIPSPDSAGYGQIRYKCATQWVRERKHVLVCETFHGLRPVGKVVRHRDDNPSNDHPANLRWGSQQKNSRDSIEHGTFTVCENNAMAKLTNQEALQIRQRRLAGESGKSLALEFGVSQSTVCDIKMGRGWYYLNLFASKKHRYRANPKLRSKYRAKLRAF